MKKKNVFILMFFAAILLQYDQSYAARKKFIEPPTISLESEKYLDKGYESKLSLLEAESKNLDDVQIALDVESLKKTLRKDKAAQTLKNIEGRVRKIKVADSAISKKIEKVLGDVRKDIESLRFTKGRDGIDIVVDNKNRQYIVSWLQENKEIVKKIPMPPVMDVTVNANYLQKQIDGKNVPVFEYLLESGARSGARIIGVLLENKFGSEYIKEHVISKIGGAYLHVKIAPNVESIITYPTGSYPFIIRDAKIKEDVILSLKPGEQAEYPYVFEAIDGGLPGIVTCYIDLSPADYVSFNGLSQEDSEIAIDLFAGSNRQQKFHYQASTIGPVPIPAPFDRLAFMNTIISYNEKAINSGWNDKMNVIKFTRDGLLKINNNPIDKKLIREFIEELDGYFNKQQILPEAYVLLKYNLQYLFEK